MRNFLAKLLSPTGLLYIYLVFTQIAQGVYSTGVIEAPPGFTFVHRLGYLWIVGWWLLKDSRKQGVAWVYDMGLFLSIAWPFIMPHYLLKTRGAKGLLVIVGFAGAFIGAFVLGAALYLIVASLNS